MICFKEIFLRSFEFIWENDGLNYRWVIELKVHLIKKKNYFHIWSHLEFLEKVNASKSVQCIKHISFLHEEHNSKIFNINMKPNHKVTPYTGMSVWPV